MKEEYRQRLKAEFDRLTTMFYASISVPLVAFIFVYLEAEKNGEVVYIEESSAFLLNFGLIILIGGLIVLGIVRYKKRFVSLEPEYSLFNKFELFKTFSLQKYLVWAFAGALTVVGYYLTKSPLYAALYSVVIILYSLHRPALERIHKDMRLSDDEVDDLIGILRK